MACSDYTDYGDALADGAFFDAIYCTFGDQLGGVMFALMVFGALILALYIHSGSIELPLVVTVILGAVVVTQLPGVAVQVVAVTLVVGMAVFGMYLILRLNRTP